MTENVYYHNVNIPAYKLEVYGGEASFALSL